MDELCFLQHMLYMKKAALSCCKGIVGEGGYFSQSDAFYLGSKKILESEIEYLEKQIEIIRRREVI